MRRRRALEPRNTLEARLWARLRDLREEGWHFRKGAPFKTFTLDFVEHDAGLVIDLLDGEPGRRPAPVPIVRDRLLSEQGYVILRLWRTDVARDPASAIHRIREILQGLSNSDPR